MIRKSGIALLLSGVLLGSGAAYADAGDFVAGAVVGAVGSAIVTHAIDNNHHRRVRRHRVIRRSRHHKIRHVKKHVAITSPEKKIQKSLKSLGFYHGAIDGQINSYETRSAIKAMNRSYEITDNAYLDPKVKDTLIYLSDLFDMDRELISNDNSSRGKARKTQAALKVLGYYHGRIDGVAGSGTRASIAEYKMAKGLSGGNRLTFEEAYRLIDSAKKQNDKNIDDAINSIKHSGMSKKMKEGNSGAVVLQPSN